MIEVCDSVSRTVFVVVFFFSLLALDKQQQDESINLLCWLFFTLPSGAHAHNLPNKLSAPDSEMARADNKRQMWSFESKSITISWQNIGQVITCCRMQTIMQLCQSHQQVGDCLEGIFPSCLIGSPCFLLVCVSRRASFSWIPVICFLSVTVLKSSKPAKLCQVLHRGSFQFIYLASDTN